MRILACLLLLTSAAVAATPDPTTEKAVLAAEKQWAGAMLHRDLAALDKLLADDLIYTHSSAKHESKADVLRVIRTNELTYKGIDFRDTKVTQYGNTAVVSHDATITTEQTGVAHLFITMVWVKQKGGWQLAMRQATKLP